MVSSSNNQWDFEIVKIISLYSQRKTTENNVNLDRSINTFPSLEDFYGSMKHFQLKPSVEQAEWLAAWAAARLICIMYIVRPVKALY